MKLQFADYLVRGNLPVVPKVFGHVSQAQPPVLGGWGMLGNSTAGCCVMSGACHETQTWFWATGRPVPDFTSASCLADYSRCLVAQGGPPYDPNNPATDTGLDPVAAALWRQTIGITDTNGAAHKIGPYAALDNPEEMALAGYLGGVAGTCWNLPDSAEDQFIRGEVWDDLSGTLSSGHYTEFAGRNSAGNLMFVTWGKLQAATDEYVAKYMSGAVAYLSKDYLLATGKSPEGINWDELAADQAAIA
jgi:hypothetical protein